MQTVAIGPATHPLPDMGVQAAMPIAFCIVDLIFRSRGNPAAVGPTATTAYPLP